MVYIRIKHHELSGKEKAEINFKAEDRFPARSSERVDPPLEGTLHFCRQRGHQIQISWVKYANFGHSWKNQWTIISSSLLSPFVFLSLAWDFCLNCFSMIHHELIVRRIVSVLRRSNGVHDEDKWIAVVANHSRAQSTRGKLCVSLSLSVSLEMPAWHLLFAWKSIAIETTW